MTGRFLGRAAAAAAIILLTAACGSTDESLPQKLQQFVLIPGSTTLAPSGQQAFVASCRSATLAPVDCPNLTWTFTGGTRASTSGTPDTAGIFTAGLSTGTFAITATSGNISQFAPILIASGPQPANITVDASTTYQTMLGWEANISSGWPSTSALRNALVDAGANDMGISRLRIPVPGQAIAANPPNWSTLDTDMSQWGMPIRAKVLARGETFQLVLDYRGVPVLPDTATYAGQVVQTLNHIKQAYGIEPALWIIKNEPDIGGTHYTGTQLGAYIRASGARARAAGYTKVMFSGPSTTDAKNAAPFLSLMVAVPGAAQYISEVSYHNYLGTATNTRTSIRDAGIQNSITTAMTEHHNATYPELFLDLTEANVSAWERGSLAGPTNFALLVVNPQNNTFTVNPDAWFLRQFFKYVRPGMVRIRATSTNGSFMPVAFRASNGATVVVVQANAAGTVVVGGLPPGTYTPSYSTTTQHGVRGAAITIGSGQTLATPMPGAGVLTIAP